MIVAIFGMLFVVKPEFSSSVIPAIGGLFSGIFAAAAYTCVRALSSREAPYTIVFYFSFFSIIVLIPFTIFTFEPMSWLQCLYLLGAGLAAAIGQIGITLAYSFAPAKRHFDIHLCIHCIYCIIWLYSLWRVTRSICNFRLYHYYRI
ncbi:putative permease [Staphylococcus gallinarum]|uniref:Putative permease n=1 Tax=Staphylococcus gallinarum TaxID=1293 RepID=A0A380FER6_STAGA|nr:putative permease [Staphylococcus gallinarum]